MRVTSLGLDGSIDAIELDSHDYSPSFCMRHPFGMRTGALLYYYGKFRLPSEDSSLKASLELYFFLLICSFCSCRKHENNTCDIDGSENFSSKLELENLLAALICYF